MGNNTASTSGTLNLLYATGTNKLAETGLNIASNGRITFAAGQTFPGTTTGTVTSVATGPGLTGGPITTSGTLSIDTSVVPQLAANNAFTGSQSVAGNISSAGTVSGASLVGSYGSITNNLNVGGTINGGRGVLITQLPANVYINSGTPSGYYLFITNYVPPVNATAFTFNRCAISATAAGQQLWMRSAIRTPTGTGGAWRVGDAFYLLTTSAGTESLFNENNDYFPLTAGQSYDFGVNFSTTPPAGTGYCSAVVQIFTR